MAGERRGRGFDADDSMHQQGTPGFDSEIEMMSEPSTQRCNHGGSGIELEWLAARSNCRDPNRPM